MPLYSYECTVCGKFEQVTSYAERDAVVCACGKAAQRAGVEKPSDRSSAPAFKMQAIVGSGERRSGSFGKSFPRRKGL